MTAINTLYELIDNSRIDGDEREIERIRTVGDLILEGKEYTAEELDRSADELALAQEKLIKEIDELYWKSWITLEKGE